MKLKFKVYSPFLFALALALLVSCSKKPPLNRAYTTAAKIDPQELLEEQQAADAFYNNESYDSAFTHYNTLKEKWLQAKAYEYAGYVCLQMAHIYFVYGSYYESESLAVEALTHIEKSGVSINLPSVYNLLGMIYRKNSDYESAIKNYQEVINYTTDSLDICITQNNIASLYTDAKQYNKALKILLPLNKYNCVNSDPVTRARVIDNIGAVYFKLNNPLALSFLERSLKMREEVNDVKGLISSYFNLYEYYKGVNKAIAKKYAILAHSTAITEKNEEEQVRALKAIIFVSNGKDRDVYTDRYISLSEVLGQKKSGAENRFAKIKYDYKSEQSKRLQLEARQAKSALKSQQDEFVIWSLTAATLVIVIIAAFIFKTQKLRHKKAKVLEAYNTESRISKKIHDELANDVFKVMSFAESAAVQYPGQQKLLHDLDAIYNKTRDISHENNTIDTGEKYAGVLKQMLADYKTETVNVLTVNFDAINWNKISAHKKIAVYRVLHELMVNMKKHSDATRVIIKFSTEKAKVIINYTDDGKGIADDGPVIKNGLRNAENRIFAIDGSLTFESSTNGLKVNCTFPA